MCERRIVQDGIRLQFLPYGFIMITALPAFSVSSDKRG